MRRPKNHGAPLRAEFANRETLLDHIRRFPDLGEYSARARVELPDTYSKVSNIVVSGMGGSGIAGDVIRDALDPVLRLPVITVKSPSVPAFADSKTLFISMSYSGQTIETVLALREALRRGCKVVGMSSGGELESEVTGRGLPFHRLPTGYLPRETLPFFLFGLLNVLSTLDMADSRFDFGYLRRSRSNVESRARRIAGEINARTVAIYTKYPSVGHRFKAQLSENAKIEASYDVFPELCHNAINVWGDGTGTSPQRIFLRDRQEPDEMRRLIESSMGTLGPGTFIEMRAEGDSRLARILNLIWTGDFISYYLAMRRDVDPVPIEATDLVKRNLFLGR